MRKADRPLVLDVVGDRVTVEHGADVDVTATGRAALVAQYSRGNVMSRSLLELVRQLDDGGYRCVVVSTCESPEPLVWPGELPAATVVLRRPNLGYDFGSWAVALDRYPAVAALPRVILTNDSMAGPFAPIAPLLEAFDTGHTDVWSLTDSYQLGRHIQSFFVGFRDGVLAEPPFRTFFRKVRVEKEKMDVVHRYEVGLTRTCFGGGYSMSTQFRSNDLGVGAENPTLAGWQQLLAVGFPFVKRTLINDPSTAPGAENAAQVVRRRFGVELSDWL
ncbi:rhamnan synthesis F family protein [Georgenia sp. M64]|uniref:rhamnan synthesis F family protein n=1 Tax=Georgenia sp. M64 TaxID=3120520 RepID=UPI0030E4D3CA